MTGSDLQYLLGFLNSNLSEYFFSTAGTTTGVGTVRWKKYKLEQLPIPIASRELYNELEDTIGVIVGLADDSKRENIEEMINRIVAKIVGLSSDEYNYVKSHIA
jgi:hypothetical protein